jgi:hypothetical protein
LKASKKPLYGADAPPHLADLADAALATIDDYANYANYNFTSKVKEYRRICKRVFNMVETAFGFQTHHFHQGHLKQTAQRLCKVLLGSVAAMKTTKGVSRDLILRFEHLHRYGFL